MAQSRCKSCFRECAEDCACDAIKFNLCGNVTDPGFIDIRLAWEHSGQTRAKGVLPTPVAAALETGMLRFELRAVDVGETHNEKCDLSAPILYTASGSITLASRSCKDSAAPDFTIPVDPDRYYVFCVTVWDGDRLLYTCYVCLRDGSEHPPTSEPPTSEPTYEPPTSPGTSGTSSTSPVTSLSSPTSPSTPASPSSPDTDPPVTDPPSTPPTPDTVVCQCSITQFVTLLEDYDFYCGDGATFRVHVMAVLHLTAGCKCEELRNCNGFWHINGEMAGANSSFATAILTLECAPYNADNRCVNITSTWAGVSGLATGVTCSDTICYEPPYD